MSFYNKLSTLFGSISSLMDNRFLSSVQEAYIKGETSVAIYGGGQFGKLWFRYLSEDLNMTPEYFVDQDPEKQGTEIFGVTVVSLETLALKIKGEVDLIVTPLLLNTDSNSRAGLEETCARKGFTPRFIPVQFSSALAMRYSIDQENCLNVIDMLYDDFSKASYYEYIRSKLAGENYRSHFFDYSQQYLADDLFTIKDNDYVVDCGAYDGDTLTNFTKFYPKLRGIASFEPTLDTFKKLKTTAEQLGKDNIRLFNMATGDQNTRVNFSHTGIASANRILDDGEESIQMCSLDEVLYEEHPTFIKMDVEGSELISLQGAKRIIAANKPILAICIYHKVEDLYQIPYFIKREFPAYRLYVRKYSNDPYELVLYAVPPHRCADNIV